MGFNETPLRVSESKNNTQRTSFESITELLKFPINGVDQWVLIRGNDINNPILLYLHGGPGASEMFNRAFQSQLEEFYTVVNWDQRGAGKSYSRSIPLATMNIEQFISDTLELIEVLRKRFKKDKIYLMGHSWGSLLGMLLINLRPELFTAYIGLGQVICFKTGEEISYHYTLEKARLVNNKKAINDLEKIGFPPYRNGVDYISIQRKWLSKFGGSTHRKKSLKSMKSTAIRVLTSKEYSLYDYIKFIKGIYFTLKRSTLLTELYQYDLFSLIPKVEIPVYFLAGRYDYCTPWELVEQYFNYVSSPKKELIWFEQSAHSPNIEERDLFCNVLINIVSNGTSNDRSE